MLINMTLRWALLAVTIALTACGGGDGTTTDPGGVGTGGETGAAAPGEANVVLRSISYTDSGNWQYKLESQTTQDATADNLGNSARTERYTRSINGVPLTWAFGPSPENAGDLYWNGSDWLDCPLAYRTTLTPVDASGSRQFNYCDMYATGTESVTRSDISGQSMSSVIFAIQGLPGGDGFTQYADYGPSSLAVFGPATFPDGSYTENVLRTVDSFAPRYADTTENRLRAYNANIAIGGVDGANPAPVCTTLTNETIDQISTIATNLEQIIGAARGTPCIFGQNSNGNGNTLPSHEWWGPSTVEYGVLTGVDARPAGTNNYYNESPSLRVAFTGATQVTYYECLVRRGDGSIRNCFSRGVGDYAIEILGDARVMSFRNSPALFADLAIDRVLIERGSRVAAGTRERAGVQDERGFNGPATDALLRQLLITVPAPL